MYLIVYPANDRFGFGEISVINKVTSDELNRVAKSIIRVFRQEDFHELQTDGTWRKSKELVYSKWDLERLTEIK